MTTSSAQTPYSGNAIKHIYVSPHSDDIALSCGGQILSNPRRSEDTLILTMFTSERGEGASEDGAMEKALFDSISEERTAEDGSAWAWAQVPHRNVGLPEALLRKRFPFKIGRGGPDATVVDAVADVIQSHAESNPQATFYFPAGFGSHVDHMACAEAGFRLLREGRLERIFLYEDVPYCWLRFIRKRHYRNLLQRLALDRAGGEAAFRSEGTNLRQYLWGALVPFPRGKKLFPIVSASLALDNLFGSKESRSVRFPAKLRRMTFGRDDLEKKRELIYRYKSQIPMLFGKNPDQLLDKFHQSFATEIMIDVER